MRLWIQEEVEMEPKTKPEPGVPDEERRRPTAELAECNCPEFCERDHDNE